MARTPKVLTPAQRKQLDWVGSTATVRAAADEKYAAACVDAAASGVPVQQIAQAAGTTYSTMHAYIRRHRPDHIAEQEEAS